MEDYELEKVLKTVYRNEVPGNFFIKGNLSIFQDLILNSSRPHKRQCRS